MRKPFIIIAFAFLFLTKTFASELSDGYKFFAQNDYKQAREHFILATNSAENKAEANLMLSLLSSIDRDTEKSFKYFLEFYNSSQNPEPYTIALWHHESVVGFQNIKTNEQIKWMEVLSQKPTINTTLKAYVNEGMGKHFEAIDNFKKSRDYLSRIGAVMEWQAVGDFENISACGFDKNYAPINHPEPDAIFKNKLNADVKWFDLYKQVAGKWIDFTNNFYCNNTLVFAQTFCQSPKDQTVYFRVGTSGSLKLWVNDQLLFAEEQERNNGIDTYVIPIKLFKGNNRILLQLGCSKINQCNFMLRATDVKGNISSDLVFTTKYGLYNKSVQEKQAPIINEAEQFLLKEIKDKPEKLLNYLVLANAYLSNDKTHEAKQILLKASEIAPNCSFILYQMVELYLRDKDRTSTSLLQEKLKQVDPENPLVLNSLINDAFDKENYAVARQLIESKEKLYGENKDLLLFKIRLASAENKAEEYTKLLETGYNKYPDEYNFVYQKYIFEKNTKRNQSGAIKILKKYSDKFFDKNALGTLAGEYIQAGKTNDGLEIIEKLITYYPFSDIYYKYLGAFYSETGNYELAGKYLEECIKVAPYYGPYHGNYATLLELMGNKFKAIEELKLNLLFQPDDYDHLKKLRNLQGKKDVFECFPSKDYYSLFKNSPSASEYPSDNIISLTEEKQVVLYANGGSESRQILMYKALTLKGIDYLKEYAIGYAANEKLNIEKAEVLKKNGNRLQAEVKDNQIVYTSLEPGDAVFLIYKKQKFIASLMAKNYFEKIVLNTWYPSLNVEYNLLVDPSITFYHKLMNSNTKPTITDVDDFKMYTWREINNKALSAEAYMPTMPDIGEVLNISTLPDWDYVSKWYSDISNTKAKPDYEVKELVKLLLKDKSNLSEMQKARIFYNYIEQNIRYSSVSFRQSGIVPQEASDVIITKIGDCKDLSVLFTSMCREAGINANVMLVCRRENGMNCMPLPSFDFDHAIAKAFLDGKEYYIELTSPYYPFAALGDNLYKAFVLNIGNDSTKKMEPFYLTPSTRQMNKIYRESKVSFTDSNMHKQVYTLRTGDQAAYSRSYYRDLGKDEREKKFTQAVSGDYANTKLLSLNFDENLNDCSDSLTYTYSSVSPKVFSEISNLSIVKLPLTDPMNGMDFLSTDDRVFPIEAWNYNTSDTVIEKQTIIIPENKQLVEIPKTVNYSCKQADYSIKFNLKGKELQIERAMTYKNDYVPVADYKEYKSFMELVVKSDTQQIGFK
jgi:predicted Zn-dependent protease